MAEDVPPPSTHHTGGGGIKGFLTDTTAGLPNWGWILVIAGGIAAAYFIPKYFGGLFGGGNQSANTSGQGGTSGLGLAVDPVTGLPYAVEGLVPSGGTVGAGTTLPPVPTPTGQAASVPQQLVALLRAPVTSGWGSGGTTIPVRSTPGGSIIGVLNPQSQIEIAGNSVSGPNNFADAPPGVGSTTWYPVAGGGYISAWDITSFQNQNAVPTPATTYNAWPNGTYQVRMQ